MKKKAEYKCIAPDMPLPCSVADNFRCKPGKRPFWVTIAEAEARKAKEREQNLTKKYIVRFEGMAIIEAKSEDDAKRKLYVKNPPKNMKVTNIEEFKEIEE